MPRSKTRPRPFGLRTRRRRIGLALSALAAAVIASGAAAAATVTRVVGAASNSTLAETVVVDTHSRTLYALRPETTRHLLCKSRACFAVWPPLTVRSPHVRLAAGHGVEGRLGLLRRSNGTLQVTLRGTPLYRYSGDTGKDEANGEGIKSFGGTWHAVTAKAKPTTQSAPQPAPSAPSMTPSTPSMTPGY
jgi:predicted lipoprotein with Yx(FWY)xxD motif